MSHILKCCTVRFSATSTSGNSINSSVCNFYNRFLVVFCATNARNTWYEWGDSWRAIEQLLKKLNVASKITLQRNKSAFALDNDGFRYALATAKGADLKSFERDAQTSWRVSRDAVIEMMRRIKEMKPFTTVSILNLNESYQAVQEMCQVR